LNNDFHHEIKLIGSNGQNDSILVIPLGVRFIHMSILCVQHEIRRRFPLVIYKFKVELNPIFLRRTLEYEESYSFAGNQFFGADSILDPNPRSLKIIYKMFSSVGILTIFSINNAAHISDCHIKR